MSFKELKMDQFDYFVKELGKYVTIDRFTPVEKIAYGLVTIIVSAVVVALVAIVVK